MFKNALIYRLDPAWSMDLVDMEVALGRQVFQPCGATQAESCGWVPPRGPDHGALVESIAGQRVLRFQLESKSVPASVIKRHLDERIAKIQEQEGRKPGRKEARELKDEIVLELLPHAFPKESSILAWFDLRRGRLVLDCSSVGKADTLISALVECLPGFRVALLNTQVAPQAAMTQWLTRAAEDWPEHFAPGRFVELNSGDEMNATVKFDRHHLDDEQMRLHIGQGKLPTQLALDWEGRVSFVLTEGAQLKKIAFLDGAMTHADGETAETSFYGDVAIATGELSALITDLIPALGGELEQPGAAA